MLYRRKQKYLVSPDKVVFRTQIIRIDSPYYQSHQYFKGISQPADSAITFL